MTLLADLSSINLDDLSDADAVRIASAIRLEVDATWWEGVVADFPMPEIWPFDYEPVLAWRANVTAIADDNPGRWLGIREFYRTRIDLLICHWFDTYDPRNAGTDRPVRMPLILFPRQREFVRFVMLCIKGQTGGLAEKCRDMGVTWVAGGISVGLWLTWPGAAVGWGSRKEQLVDRLGDPDSIFEKLRMIVDGLPAFLLPNGFSRTDHMTYMKMINPETAATITGEAGDNIGRGGRKLIYLKDESAHYERPERIEAALADNTRVQIDISTPNGLGNVFHRRRENGKVWIGGAELELDPGQTAVFIFDWRDHPAKTEEWFEERKMKAADVGMSHVFAQEVLRDYAASVEGVIIPAEWIKSCIDAHIHLAHLGKWEGVRVASLDVADGGGDTNGFALRNGSILEETDEWSERDTGVTTRRAVGKCQGKGFIDLQYDPIGVGSGVKAEANRLAETLGDDGRPLLPEYIRLVPWNASAAPLEPDEPVVPDDRDSPTNGDFFHNLKAQAHWSLRLRCERTHRARTEGIEYDPADLFSIPSTLPMLRQVEKELAQPTRKQAINSMKMLVDKKPEGTKSPNVGDAIVSAFHPVPGLRAVFSVAPSQVVCIPFDIPPNWPRAYGMRADDDRVCAAWGAYDKQMDVLYLVAEHSRLHAEPTAHAAAIKARGAWIPGVLMPPASRNLDELRATLATWMNIGLARLDLGDRAIEAGIVDMNDRIATGRFKIFQSCQMAITEYQSYRRGDGGELIGDGLMDCARILCRPTTIGRMIVRPHDSMIGGAWAGPADEFSPY